MSKSLKYQHISIKIFILRPYSINGLLVKYHIYFLCAKTIKKKNNWIVLAHIIFQNKFIFEVLQ